VAGTQDSLAGRDKAAVRALSAFAPGEDVYAFALAAIGNSLGWQVGAAWEPDPRQPGHIGCVGTWSDGTVNAVAFEAATRATTLAFGEGLPGHVWAEGSPDWWRDVGADLRLPRREAAATAGLVTGVCFAVRSGEGTIGAIEFFTSADKPRDERLLATMENLGLQVGHLVQRARAERAALEGEERLRAVLEAALDCIVIIDEVGTVLEFNPAAERTFGLAAAEAVGREMAEVIVPEDLRARHREGLRRCVSGASAGLLGRRVETEGLRADGTRFPVELTITRIAVPGPATFAGHLRDITEQRHARDELRASRMRIVEAADAARRRIERDLHDGAQQHLVGVGLSLRVARQRLTTGADGGVDLLDEAIGELGVAADQLRELARGIHPAVLTEGGLEPALRGLLARCPVPAELVAVPSERLAPAVEATAYFCVAEALTNVARYADATGVEISAVRRDGLLEVSVRDDGRGGAEPSRGTGLRGLEDRLAALDGVLVLASAPGEGTLLRAEIPCAS
jgi:PAS domain S-box-containing protein